MAVVAAELAAHPRGSETRDGLSVAELWNVWCDSAADSILTVLASPLLPAIGDRYLSSDSQVTTRKPTKASQKPDAAGRWLYRVEVEYQRVPFGELHPLSRPTIVTANGADTEEVATRYDLDDLPGVNTAGDFFAGGMPVTLYHGCFQLSRVVAMAPTDRPGWVRTYNGCASNASFYGIPSGVVMVKACSAEPFEHEGVEYTKIAADFKVHALGWRWDQKKILNAGLRMKVAGGGGSTFVWPIKGDDGAPITEPVPLDADGMPGDRNSPVFVTRRLVRVANLSAMGF